MLKNTLSTIAGIAAGVGVIFLMQMVGHAISPPPADLNFENPEELKAWIAVAPPLVFLLVLLSYTLGSFAGGFVAAVFGGPNKIFRAIIVGAVLMVFGIVNLVMIPHPLWFAVVSTALYIPLAWVGGMLGGKIGRGPEKQQIG